MRERRTARVVLLDPDDRVLLLKGRLPSAPEGPSFWFTAGGGLEEGESVLEAATRELLEETGFADVVLGPALWRDEVVLEDVEGEARLFRQTYILGRTAGGPISRDGWQDYEHDLTDDARWWSLPEIVAAEETIYPIGLAELLAETLAGRIAAEPLLIATPDGPVSPPPRVPWPAG
jgi:8-oxo-dGTP pyrophosphatase MutT (NUDIX family)